MKDMKDVFLAAFAAMSALTFILFGTDKAKAGKGGKRIPEKVLLTFSALGGAAGGLLGMLVFRHKTRKPVFFVFVPLFLALQVFIILFLEGVF